MKKRHQLVSVIAAIFMIASLTGCNGLFSPEKSFDNEVSDTSLNYGGTAILTGVIENYDDIMRERNGKPTSKSNARLILPVLDGNLYDFYLFGERGSMFCGPYKLDSDSFIGQTSGTFKYRLPQGAWNLTLAAMEPGSTAPTATECKAGLADKAWLIAKSYIDLSQGQAQASFVLSPEGLSTNGKVKLTVHLEGWSLKNMLATDGVREHMTITAEIRDLKTNAVIKTENSTAENQKPSTRDLTSFFKGADKAVYDGSAGDDNDEYKPGTYNFVVTFKDETAGKKAEWVWSDKIMIFPGVTTDEDVYISRIVQDPPKAPAALVVSYEGSENLPATDEDQVFYKATFKWLGKYLEESTLKDITNETHFELEVANISGVAGKSLSEFKLDSTDALSTTNPIKWSDDSAATSSIEYIKLSTDGKTNTKSVIRDTSTNKGTGTIKAYNYAVSKDNDYVKGSLYANNEEITLWLKLGEEYAARIRAVNKTGASPWTYVSLKDSPAPSTLAHPTGTFLFLEKTINEYYIKYWLNGGDATPSKYPIGYKMEFGPKAVTQEGDEAANSIGLRYWNAPKEKVKANGVLLSGWKRKSSDTNLYNVSKAQEISYTNPANITVGDGSTDADKLIAAGYKKTITRTIKTYYPDGLWKEEVKEFVSKEDNPAAPTAVDGKFPATPGSGWSHVKNCTSSSTATDVSDEENIAYTPLLIYDGYQNIDLWAQYDTDFDWSFITNYKLKKENITYQLGSYDGTTFTPATGYDTGKALGGTNTNTATIVPSGNNYYIQWNIKNDENWKFTHYTVSVKPTDTSPYVIDRVRTTEIKDKNNATTIVTDLSSCAQGSVYLVTIDAGIPGTQYSDSVPIVLYVE